MEESYKLDKAIDLLISEVKIYDQYYCLATSQALKTVLNELERLQLINQSLENTKDTCPEMATSGIRCYLKNALNSEKTMQNLKLKYLIDSNLEKTEDGEYIVDSNACQTLVRHLIRIVDNEEYDVTCLHCGKDTPLYCENCYQELISKNAELQLENEKLKTLANKKQWISPCYVSENYIPKQAIRDTIEELESYKRKEWDTYNAHLSGKIAILKELLGE